MPEYANYLLANKLDDFVKEQIAISKEIKLPLLKYLEIMPEQQLFELASQGATEFLKKVAENKTHELITSTLKQWLSNELPEINKDQILQDDITLIGFVRKTAFLKFLPCYSTDVLKIIEIVKEIDKYILELQSSSINVYINILLDKIKEHVHFIEKINKTSPGTIYVYDLIDEKEIYSNNKMWAILGYRKEDYQEREDFHVSKIIHPDDRHTLTEYLNNIESIKDDEIRSFRFRGKDKNGEYRWMRNYETIFKRTSEGKPQQLIGISLDVDKEKKTAEQLQAREEQLLEAQELAEMGSYTWDIGMQKADVTPQIYKILELNPAAQFDEFLDNIYHSDRLRVKNIINTAIREKGIYEYECRYLAGDTEKIIWSKGTVSERDGSRILKGTIMDVTSRHNMIQKLQRSDELYKEAQSLTHIGNWTWEIKTDKMTWSEELYKIFNLNPQFDKINFEKFASFIHPEDREEAIKNIRISFNTTAPYAFFFKIIINGAVKILHAISETRIDEKGNAYKSIGTFQDVTHQKQIEKQLIENENFIKKIADATPSIIASYNINTGKYTFISHGFQKLLGYDPQDVFREGVSFVANLIHPEDIGALMEKNVEAIEFANNIHNRNDKEIIIEFQYRMLHKNGEYKWIHTYGTVFDRNSEGKVEHILNISLDISDKIEAEKKLKEQENFTLHLAEASPTILYLFDLKEKRFLYVNREVVEVLGYSPQEIISLRDKVGSFLHSEDHLQSPEKHLKYKHSIDQSLIHQFEARILNKENKWKWLLTREIVFKRDEAGKALQVIGSALDITDRKEMEEALIHKTFQLQQSNASLEEFAHIASHDLQEPLRKISTFGDRLLTTQRDKLGEEGQMYLDKIINSAQRMQQLINDILSISMISADKRFTFYSLETLLAEVLQTLDHKIEKTKAIITSDHLPEAKIVPSQFRQLFQNLIINSLKFVAPDVQPVIKINHEFLSETQGMVFNLKNSNRYLKITCEDNGIGFEEVYAEKIFAIFQRLHGRSEYEGTGIGLAICKKIVENHEGIIIAEPLNEQGSIFTIIIPV